MNNTPITEIIKQRFSCRNYQAGAIDSSKQKALRSFIASLPPGPFGSISRFELIAATEADRTSLRGLGTYGFIHNPSGFIVGAMKSSEKDLEDYGYLMECIILHATRLDLGTCWLGGSFTKSSFANKVHLGENESMPAIFSIGEFDDPEKERRGILRRLAKGHSRLLWEELFFDDQFDHALDHADAGAYAVPLEMVRLAPSASNKQPWRVIRKNMRWHFYLQRTPGYREDPLKHYLGLCDLQRLDLEIAMCHFELTAREFGLTGHWAYDMEPDLPLPQQTEYVASWEDDNAAIYNPS